MLDDLSCAEHAPVVRVDDGGGALTYVVAGMPDTLSAVTERDLSRAWDAARRHPGRPPAPCRFRFEHPDGTWTEFALHDRAARRWAAAVEDVASLRTFYGVSLCIRLLALSALLGTAEGSARRRAAEPGRALLRSAAHAPLTPTAGFDAAGLGTLLAQAAPAAHTAKTARDVRT